MVIKYGLPNTEKRRCMKAIMICGSIHQAALLQVLRAEWT